MNKTAADILRESKALIEDPKNWWDGSDYKGGRCALTALDSNIRGIRARRESREAFDTLQKVARGNFHLSITQVNDRLGHAVVMKMYDRAIELAESQNG